MKIGILSLLLIVALGITAFFVSDLLFSSPEHQKGVIIEKIFVPGRMTHGQTPYAVGKRSKYFVTHQKDDQWVAIVVINSDTVRVHCHPDHYKAKEVGDIIHFKKYDGHLVHIEYFAHNEEEE